MELKRVNETETSKNLESSCSHLLIDENEKKYLCKWTDGTGGYALDEYNAMIVDRWLDLNNVPNVKVLSKEDISPIESLLNIENIAEHKKPWAIGTLKSKKSSSPVLIDWYEYLPMWFDVYSNEVESGTCFIISSGWHNIEMEITTIFDCIILNFDRGRWTDPKNILVDSENKKFILIDNQYSIQRAGEIMIEESGRHNQTVQERIDDYAESRSRRIRETILQEPSLKYFEDKIYSFRDKNIVNSLTKNMLVSNREGFDVFKKYLLTLGSIYYRSYFK